MRRLSIAVAAGLTAAFAVATPAASAPAPFWTPAIPRVLLPTTAAQPSRSSDLAPTTGTAAVRAPKRRAPVVELRAGFSAGARLGRETALSISIGVDPRRVHATLNDVRLLTPANLDITMSALGVSTCRRPPTDFARVKIGNETFVSCPGNAALGNGTSDAELRFAREEAVAGAGRLSLFNGAPRDGRPGLVVLVATQHPLVTQLVYGGYLYTAPRPYGLGMRIMIPPMVDPPFDATVAMTRLRMTIGGDDLAYTRRERGHQIRYAPGGIPLPDRCPRGGFPFRAILRFDDGSRRTAETTVRCPPRAG
ncbi:MAG: hypothetical protein WC558_05135 [Patulibacter sp.]